MAQGKGNYSVYSGGRSFGRSWGRADEEEERGGGGGGWGGGGGGWGGGGGGWGGGGRGSQPSSSEDSFTMSVASSDVGRIIGTGLVYVHAIMADFQNNKHTLLLFFMLKFNSVLHFYFMLFGVVCGCSYMYMYMCIY